MIILLYNFKINIMDIIIIIVVVLGQEQDFIWNLMRNEKYYHINIIKQI